MAAEWSYLLADLRTNRITAEIPLTGAKPTKRLGAAGSMSGTWTLSSRWSGDDPYGLTRPARTALYALRDGRPMWGGVLWTSSYDSTNGQIQLGAADWWSYFDHRKVLPLLGATPTVTDVAQVETTYTATDQNDIARALVALAATHTGGDIGITVDTTTSGVLRDRTYYGYDLPDVGQVLQQLSEVDGGPDIMFDTATDLDTDGRPVRLMRLGTPLLGQMGSPWVFETGANILAYQWPSDGTRMTTRAFAKGEGSERGSLIAVAEDTTRYDDGWALLETDTSYHTVAETDTLQGHADADRYAARLPVVLPTITVAGNGLNNRGQKVGPAIGEYGPGDDARVIISDPFFSAGLDTTMRIVAITLDPGDDGVETATLTMAPMLDDVA